LQVKLCDSCLSALYVPWCEKALYKYSSFPFLSKVISFREKHLIDVYKNVPPLTCYNLYTHGLIATIFGKNVAENVGKQNILYFPTPPN